MKPGAKRQDGKLTDSESICKTVRERLEAAWTYEKENREEAAVDLAFLAGDQWPDQVRRERERERRPMLTINRLPQFLRQVTNDIRQADLAIKVSPVDDRSDPELAKIYNGLLRQIQYQSSAQHVYATAAEHAAACGIGWFRITSDWADDSGWDQELAVERIPHPLSVYCDPVAIEPNRSDAMWMIVTEMIPHETFKERYPKAAPNDVDLPADGSESRLFWLTREGVRVAEYWCRVPYEKTIGLTAEGESVDLTDIKPEMRAFMPPIVRERKQTAYRVKMYMVSGTEILSGPHEWAGKYIPLVPVIGAEIPLRDKIYRHGVIRYARDPQQMYNYMRTAAAEWIGAAPKSPYLVTTTMLGDPAIKSVWDSHNSQNRPYLPYKPDPAVPGGPKREAPPLMPSAMVQESQIAADDMKSTTGIHDAGLGRQSNETSGRAIIARQREGDTANYHYADNLELSLEHAGRILIDLIPKIYDNERVIRLMGDDDSEEFAPINQVLMGVDGMPMVKNDLSTARFDVRVSIGPSYSTKRMETADAMLQLVQALPGVGEIGADLIAKNLDFPGADELAKRLRNVIPPHVLADPDDPSTQPPPPPDPMADPGVRAEIGYKLAQSRKALADARKVEMETQVMFGQAMMQPEPPLMPPEAAGMPQQGPSEMPPDMMQGEIPPELSEIDPAALEQMLSQNPIGPVEPAFGASVPPPAMAPY